ncbi:MAG: C69 family dipeptidase [bacterium]
MKSFLMRCICIVFFAISISYACTSLLVTKGASKDGSTMITYTCDGPFLPHLKYEPAADNEPGDSVDLMDWSGNVRGKIAQVTHTYAVMGLMNEHQLVIGETTFDGREELRNPKGLLFYWDLMYFALQRAKTAREAIQVIADLIKEYGYASTGESFSIADPREVWIMEIIGHDSTESGAEWVAVRVPDGYISCHANKARIGEILLHDKKNSMYSENVISYAVEKGYYDPSSGEPFLFCDAYCPATLFNKRLCDSRVWSIFCRAAPSRNFSSDFFRCVQGAKPYPLWIKPDHKLSIENVFALMRNHFEGTDWDMTKGVDAGAHGLPYRWRPVLWTVDSIDYLWERAISTQQTAYSFVSQSRSWLPDPIGGVYWYGVDDTWYTVYIPFYCGSDAIPKAFATGDYNEFSWDSAFWIFNLVSNFSYLRYSYMIEDIQKVQRELEGNFLQLQPEIEKTALGLHKKNKELMVNYLTDYSNTQAEKVVQRWRELGGDLIVKYIDGYVKDEHGHAQWKGYPESWYERITALYSEKFYMQPHEFEEPDSE